MFVAALTAGATNYFVATTGSDNNAGTESAPFATLGKAILKATTPGDIVYIEAGTYIVKDTEIMGSSDNGLYKLVYDFKQKGKEGNPIKFIGKWSADNKNRPVFDFSNVSPEGCRVTAFHVGGQYLEFQNFEVVGVQNTIADHSQSENFRIDNASYCTFDNIAVHDGMGIGFYVHRKSHHNLFVNCDAYRNYDTVGGSSKPGDGGNNDGFGCHVSDVSCINNIFIGCRAWANTDDGFDLINCYAPVTIAYSYAYRNGYASTDDVTYTKKADGNGFKSGGYGMSASDITLPEGGTPMHNIYHNISAINKANGFYSNHHLGGIYFHDNSAYNNGSSDYSMVNRKGATASENVDVDGYGHTIKNNLSYNSSKIAVAINRDECEIADNSFTWDGSNWVNNADITDASFTSLNYKRIISKRHMNGTYSESSTFTFMQQPTSLGFGADFSDADYEQAIADAKKISGAEATAQAEEQEEQTTTTKKVHTIGDSTMSDYDQDLADEAGMYGWGTFLGDYLTLTSINWADQGESTSSFYKKFWPAAKAEIKSGDIVIIQFGHNDQKSITTAEYRINLAKYIDEVRALGATPILATSICRKLFSGKTITRLGRIDDGDKNGVGIDDHTYDFPYNMQLVAQEKNCQIIDMTTATKTLLEEWGPSGSLQFFPAGGSTHTNELGARVNAMIAAQLFYDGNTALKEYVKTEAIAIPHPAEDQNIETVVTDETTWSFIGYTDQQVIADKVVDKDGLYLRGGSGSYNITARKVSGYSSVTFSDGTTVATPFQARSAGADQSSKITADNTAGEESSINRTFAVNIGAKGTFYVFLSPTSGTSGRTMHLLFNGEDVDNIDAAVAYANSNHLAELKYEADETGTFYITSGQGYNLVAARFVPKADYTEEDWNYYMVKTGENGYATFGNLAGENLAVPAGLTAYAVTKSSEDGKVNLMDVGSVMVKDGGFVVKGESNTEYSLEATTATPSFNGENLMVANTAEHVIPQTNSDGSKNYILAIKDGITAFYLSSGEGKLRQKKAYLRLPAEASAKEIISFDITTAISKHTFSASENMDNSYNLAGQHVGKNYRGIVIRNGKKYIQ